MNIHNHVAHDNNNQLSSHKVFRLNGWRLSAIGQDLITTSSPLIGNVTLNQTKCTFSQIQSNQPYTHEDQRHAQKGYKARKQEKVCPQICGAKARGGN